LKEQQYVFEKLLALSLPRSTAGYVRRQKGLIYVNFTITKRIITARLLHLAKTGASAVGVRY